MKNRLNIVIGVLLLVLGCTSTKLESPTGLLCELLRYPEKAVITDSIPEFSWIVPDNITKQNSYRIMVASSKLSLDENKPDLWDSDKILSEESVSVSYAGSPLAPNKSYWWKVKIWDSHGNSSDYSSPQQFNTSAFEIQNKEWPGKSNFIKLANNNWVSENRQTATFTKVKPAYFKQNNNQWFGDFGKAAFGTLELKINSEVENKKLEIYLGERKNDDLTVNKNPGHSNIGFEKIDLELQKGTHEYQLKIPQHHSNSPNTQKLAPFYPEVVPFRYVEINGESDLIDILDVQQYALYYPFDESASNFYCSDSNLNKVWDLCKYTLKATPFLGLYADGNRERMPYEADAFIQQLGHYSVDREFSIARYTTDFLIYNPSWPTEWHIHSVLMAWKDYMHSGDVESLKKNYKYLRNKTLIALAREDGLISTTTGKVTEEFLNGINFSGKSIRDIVDWPKGTPEGTKQARNAGPTPEGERDGYIFTHVNTVVNSFHYQSLVLMSKIAEVLKKDKDILFFNSQAEKVKTSLQAKLFDKSKGVYLDGEDTDHSSLHANMFPLAFNLVPKENVQTVVQFIKDKGMACSVYGAQYLLEALFNAGESEYAISLMTSSSKRSWLNMLNVGSTMTTEAWDEYYKPNLTWNHAWGSAPANIIPRRLIGIEPIEAGFKKFRVVPQPGKLKSIKLKIPSVRGTIQCNLEIKNDTWNIELSVPGNSEAELYLPSNFSSIFLDSEKQSSIRSSNFAGEVRNVFLIKSGQHKLTASEVLNN